MNTTAKRLWSKATVVLDKLMGISEILDSIPFKKITVPYKTFDAPVVMTGLGPQSAWCLCGPQSPQGPYPACSPSCRYGYQPEEGNQSGNQCSVPGPTPSPEPDTIDPVVDEWTFNRYQKEALMTADCPLIGHPIVYPLLGLVGEFGEVYEKLTKHTHGNMIGVWKYPSRGELIKELGDVLWYVAVMADRLGLKLQDLSDFQEESMTLFGLNTKEAGILPASSFDIEKTLGDLAISVGCLCERVKKVFRDGSGELDGERRESVIKELSDVLWFLAGLCQIMRIDFSLAAHMNIQKLLSRRERNPW
jgi:NTP pyrophosphatase (non-canonical NTP hydrolase)